jgi:pSer/pThr/pTyr-binding forkhead associated (FHA) protein
MVNPLSHLENLAESLIEGTVARLLGARLQPVEVARYLARAMEDGRVVGARGEVIVPNAYWVRLHPDDMQALASYRDTLQSELTRTVASMARSTGASMQGRPRVFLEAASSVPRRRVRVEARMQGAQPSSANLTHTQVLDPAPLQTGGQAAAPAFALVDRSRRMPIAEALVTIGRSLDNDIVLDDERVSRKHAQLRRRYGQYVLYDRGSSGGTTVNGHPADETPLRHGDVLAFAGVKVRFEQLDVAAPAPPDPLQVTTPMPHPPRRASGLRVSKSTGSASKNTRDGNASPAGGAT